MISFFIHGRPVAQGSTRAFKHRSSGQVITTSSAKGLGPWRRRIADAAQPHAHMHEGPLDLRIVFLMPRPKSLPKTKWRAHTKRPDIDKLVRAVLDALDGIFYADDSQVANLRVVKAYAPREGPMGVRICVAKHTEGVEDVAVKWAARATDDGDDAA